MASVRKSYSVKKKLEVIQWHKTNGATLHLTSKKFGIDRKNLREWIRNESLLHMNDFNKRKIGSGQRPLSEELDEKLYKFFQNEKNKKINVSNLILRQQAKKIASKIGILNFKASSQYIANFKRRYNISCKTYATKMKKQKELAAQNAAELTTESEISNTTDIVHETSGIESFNILPAVSNNDLTQPLVSNADAIESSSISNIHISNINTIQNSGINTIQSSSPSQEILKDNPCSSSLPKVSISVQDPLTFKKARHTRVGKSQVNLENFNRNYYSGKIIHCSKETQTIKPSKGISISGRRIIDFDYFFAALKRASNHSKFGCNLNDIVIENEKKIGICTQYSLRCTQCNYYKTIWSENVSKKKNLNSDFVSAMLNIKCNFQAINELLSTLHLPSLTNAQFNKECDKINKKSSEKALKKKNNSISTTEKDIPPVSDENQIIQQVDIGSLLVQEEFEIKEENVLEKDNEQTDKMIIDQEELTFNPTIIKQEIDSDMDDESVDSTINRIETLNRESLIETKQTETVLPQQRETSMCKNDDLCKTTVFQSIQDNKSIKLMSSEMKITDKENMTNFDNQSKTELCHKIITDENRMGIDNLNNTTENQEMSIPTASSKENKILEHKSTGLLTTTPPTNIIGGNYVYLMPIQPVVNSLSNNSSLIASQMPPSAASATYQGTNSATFMPETSTAVTQNSSESNNGLANLSSFANNFSTPNNQLILLPDMMGVTYMPSAATTIHQPVNSLNADLNNREVITMPSVVSAVQQHPNLSNVSLNNEGAVSIPFSSSTIPQPSNSVNIRPPLNADVSRWIGRANMNSIDPSCTLPGGAPKGVSDPVPPRKNTSHQSKRQQFHCNDCNISFAKYKSWDLHKKSYCIKRLKLQPSSTITSHISMNNNSLQAASIIHAKPVTQPHLEELLSAMAVRRLSLEASMKTALEAQTVINLHKSAQDLTRKSFKELDNALNKEKALTSKASLEEHEIASKIRTQALTNAKAAYMQEKYSASAVEEALYRQKSAIEATLTATGHEQAALISTLKGLRIQSNKTVLASVFQTPYNFPGIANFNQEKLTDATLA